MYKKCPVLHPLIPKSLICLGRMHRFTYYLGRKRFFSTYDKLRYQIYWTVWYFMAGLHQRPDAACIRVCIVMKFEYYSSIM